MTHNKRQVADKARPRADVKALLNINPMSALFDNQRVNLSCGTRNQFNFSRELFTELTKDLR